MSKSSKLFVGMDVHKDSIDIATGDDSASEVRHYGTIGSLGKTHEFVAVNAAFVLQALLDANVNLRV